jgi:hypothetical protein
MEVEKGGVEKGAFIRGARPTNRKRPYTNYDWCSEPSASKYKRHAAKTLGNAAALLRVNSTWDGAMQRSLVACWNGMGIAQ